MEEYGYHKRTIFKGFYGDISKVSEEVDEYCDAREQGIKIMEILELSDIYGALEAVTELYQLTMEDLKKEFLTNKEYSSILIGSKASGGGAPRTGKSFGSAEDGKPVILATLKPGELAARITANKEAQQNE